MFLAPPLLVESSSSEKGTTANKNMFEWNQRDLGTGMIDEKSAKQFRNISHYHMDHLRASGVF